MTWTKRTQPLKVGDKVAYSKAFLQSTGSYTGDIPHARGEVTALISIGETTLAEITWDKPDLPAKVNVKNLVSVQRIAYE
ncbi:MAG TPA: hypothetical protein VNX28_10390 [Gemmataceae bacterium]|jgi:hypothetical protein|nr:hypothetical protein [Gemmataceae bacterium]